MNTVNLVASKNVLVSTCEAFTTHSKLGTLYLCSTEPYITGHQLWQSLEIPVLFLLTFAFCFTIIYFQKEGE